MPGNPSAHATAGRWWLALVLAGAAAFAALAGAALLLLWGIFAAPPPDGNAIAARVQEIERFRSVTLADCTEGAYLGQAADADGTVYDLTATVHPSGVVTYEARSREKDASRQRLAEVPDKHLGLRDVVLAWKGDGWAEGTGTSDAGELCGFSLKRQAVPPFKDGVAYEYRVLRPAGQEWSGVVQMHVDPKVRQGSFRW